MSNENKPSIPDVIDRFRKYHERELAWGSLHVVLDDGNVDNDFVQHCIDYADKNGDVEGRALGEILIKMSRTQRLKIGRIA